MTTNHQTGKQSRQGTGKIQSVKGSKKWYRRQVNKDAMLVKWPEKDEK